MSINVVRFDHPDIEYPVDRVSAFIRLCQSIDTLIPYDEWGSDIWHVGDSFRTKAQNRDRRVFAFYNLERVQGRNQEILSGEPLPSPYRDFAKSYMKYTHSTSPVAFENEIKRLNALQFIEAAFRSFGLTPKIEFLNVNVLNEAVSLAAKGVGPARHYQFAIYIQQVHRFCMNRRLLAAPFQWKHGIRKPKDQNERLGPQASAKRSAKLPSVDAFHALAHVFRNAESFEDKLFSAISAILISIPLRAHEVLQLRLECEVFEKVKDPETGELREAYGIRVFPGKGNPPQVKWVPTQMVSIVKEAVDRIRGICSTARSVAAWYEMNPGVIWLPEWAQPQRSSEWLTQGTLSSIVPSASKYGTTVWAKAKKIKTKKENGSTSFNLPELTQEILGMLPRDFPHFNGDNDQKYSETLALLHRNQLHKTRAEYPCVVEQVTIIALDRWLSGHRSGTTPSVFQRWGFTERDGTEIKITTHAFRHWLNTIAHIRGMSELDIAKWSGRHIAQNKAYDHVTPEETLSQIRAALDSGDSVGPMFEAGRIHGVNSPVEKSEFLSSQIGAALTTELGICVHDYSLLPCQSHGDCLNCTENVFFKGDHKHLTQIEGRRALTEKQLSDAHHAMGEDNFGADKWVQSHQASLAKLNEIISIHQDSNIKDGTVVNLSGASRDSDLAMSLRDRRSLLGQSLLSNDRDDLDDELLTDMWGEL
ncbi:hypothetical protein [Donghicola tyrosinivorans]|uniref:Integrase n=1 Tax=Donghicola tyrosinivorans TaxID=1652492 RepID=A0A2T0X5V4_9RHOB|nr:hypothetical protein [Donghicola tyrosinivorans]PRY94303.1 hypothetical protein CLV74_101440 [Donghicola tyrosinivorans]